MSEFIVISDDDLEEGEIPDEVEVIESVEIEPKPRSKKLPRRYVLHENKDLNPKHSKHHRKSSHHKKHHKCPRHSEHSKLGTNRSSCSNSGSSRSHLRRSTVSSTLSSLKSAFRNYSSPRREPAKKNNTQKSQNEGNTLPQFPVSVPMREELKSKEERIIDDTSKESTSSKPESDSLNVSKPEPTTQDVKLDESYKLINAEEDEEEDEEELRRIALATCLKVPVRSTALVSDNSTVNIVNNDQCSSNKAMNKLLGNCDIYLPGNNDIVDMELDSDDSAEDVQSDLFVIDKKPLNLNSNHNLPEKKLNANPEPYPRVKSPSNQEFLLSNSQNLSIDDIEEAALRAQVIASMRSAKQIIQEVPLKPFPTLAVGNTNEVLPPPNIKAQSVQNRKVIRSQQPYFKSPVNFLNMTRKRVVNKAKLNYLKSLNHKRSSLLPQRKINAGPERLVITLNNDSSTEESDEENDQSKGPLENTSIASIEALISDARQKSDVVRNDSTNVSCLSKAQQEEYNNLKKILAEKEVMPKKTAVDAERKKALQLKILSKEVLTAQTNLSKEIDMLTSCEKELFEKKQEYMTSKLKAQLLKEQLHAAEVVRATNLEAWKKTAAKLDIQKKSVSKHKAIVDLLQKKLSTNQLPLENSVLSSNKNIDLAT